ncbi:spore germination protein [Paenibacillus sinensis]|uniref:spore germination protein n=1 Tax=Paenibacillus TaxID=44249 RepID=UPI00223C3F55
MQAGFTLLIPIVFIRLINRIRTALKKIEGKNGDVGTSGEVQAVEDKSDTPLSADYESNRSAIQEAIGGNCDVHFRDFEIPAFQKRATLIYVEGMIAEEHIDTQVMQAFMTAAWPDGKYGLKLLSPNDFAACLIKNLLPASEVTEEAKLVNLNEAILNGNTALLVEGMPQALLVGTPDGKTRSIAEPISEGLVRGPRTGFSEQLSDNTAILRRQGRTEKLEMKKHVVGNVVKRDLVLAYMKDIVNPELLREVEKRIANIDLDFIAESGYVEQLIEDDMLSPFQQAQNTERPDRVMNALMDGRIAILLDGTPFALIVPVTFTMLLQSPEDYYERWIGSSLLRLLRFAAAFLALMAPSLYISFISFHPGLIPTDLAITIIQSRQRVPFPSLIEILILEVSIEILREAAIRLPKPIGPAMGIVGGLIIGEAAVQAGIVSPFLVIVVSVTAVASFSIPMYSTGITLRILRFVGMFFAAVLGILGTILFFLFICSHLTRLKSFGVPYVTPISPFRIRDWKDLFIRAPLNLMKRRPQMMKTIRRQR